MLWGWPHVPRCATGWGHLSVTELCPLHEVTDRDSQAGRAVGGGSPIAPCPCPPSSAPCPLALPAPQARSRCEATVTAPFPGLCRNVTAQSHLELKVWICHTLRNELLGAASVSLGSLLKGGGKRTYGGAQACASPARGRGDRTGVAAVAPALPGREQGAVVCPGPGVPEAIPASARAPQPARKHKPLCYLPPFAVARAWLVTAAPT